MRFQDVRKMAKDMGIYTYIYLVMRAIDHDGLNVGSQLMHKPSGETKAIRDITKAWERRLM